MSGDSPDLRRAGFELLREFIEKTRDAELRGDTGPIEFDVTEPQRAAAVLAAIRRLESEGLLTEPLAILKTALEDHLSGSAA